VVKYVTYVLVVGMCFIYMAKHNNLGNDYLPFLLRFLG